VVLFRCDDLDSGNVGRRCGHHRKRRMVQTAQSARPHPIGRLHGHNDVHHVVHSDARRRRRDVPSHPVVARVDTGRRRRVDAHALLVFRASAGLFLDHGCIPHLVHGRTRDLRRPYLQRRADASRVHSAVVIFNARRYPSSVRRSGHFGRLEVAAYAADLWRRHSIIHDRVRYLRDIRAGSPARGCAWFFEHHPLLNRGATRSLRVRRSPCCSSSPAASGVSSTPRTAWTCSFTIRCGSSGIFTSRSADRSH